MSTLDYIELSWVTTDPAYTLEYKLTNSLNPYYEEFELYEFGIHCKLFDNLHQLLSEAEVAHISPDKNYVTSLIQKMILHKVFPVHLIDVVSDELVKDLDI